MPNPNPDAFQGRSFVALLDSTLVWLGTLVNPIYTHMVGTVDVNIVGGGGGPVTIADGADAAEGAKADSAATDSTSSWSVVSLLKGILAGILDIWNKTTHAWAVTFTNTSIGTTFTNSSIAVTQGTAANLNATVTGSVTASVTGSVTANAGTNLNTSALALESGGNLAAIAATIGCSIYSFLSTAAVQAAQIKGSAGKVYGLQFFNNSATICYVRLYNETGTPGTGDTPFYRGLIPANSTSGSGFVVAFPNGVTCGTGIGIRVTAAVADNDATALAANAILGNVFWI